MIEKEIIFDEEINIDNFERFSDFITYWCFDEAFEKVVGKNINYLRQKYIFGGKRMTIEEIEGEVEGFTIENMSIMLEGIMDYKYPDNVNLVLLEDYGYRLISIDIKMKSNIVIE